MERKLVLWLAVGVILLAATILTQGFFYSHDSAISDQPGPSERLLDRLWEAYQKTREEFYQPDRVDEQRLLHEAIRGMIEGLDDPFSRFNTREEYQRFRMDLEGEYEGIGAYIGLRAGEVTIIAPIKGGPAERQGIRAGDVVLEIDGESTQGFSVDDAARRLRGPKETSVQVKIRHRDGSVEEITIVRDRIQIPSVESKLLNPAIAYVRINTFNASMPSELQQGLRGLQNQSRSIQGLILDLRGNGGGYLDAAKQVGSLFVERGEALLIQRSRAGEIVDRSFGNDLPNWPIAVLVDQGTASASEILAGAIRDNDMGILIGRHTFGKGVIQSPFTLSDGSVLILTTAEYLTPDGHRVQEVGLAPNLPVEDWHPTLLEARGEVRALEQSFPQFALASRAILQQLNQLLEQIEDQANQDEYEGALGTLEELTQRLRASPQQLLSKAGTSESDPEILLIPTLLEKLAKQLEPVLAELKARLEQNDIAVALQWLQSPSIRGQSCPCVLTTTAPTTDTR